MSRVNAVIVVYDATCGECADIADRLRAVLRPPVRVRSCRDPALAETYPALRGHGCRAPALGMVRTNGSVRWWKGLSAVFGALSVVRLSRLPAAVAVLLATLRTRARSTD